MGVTTTIRVNCDYSDCGSGQKGPVAVEWVNEEIKAGKPAPPEAADVITFDMNGTKLAFCTRLHAAKFFAPASHEVVLKKVI